MKTVVIPLEIKEALDEFREGKPVTKSLRILVDEFDEIGDLGESKGKININMDDDVHYKLNRMKLYPTESIGSVIFRLIRMHNEKNKLTYNTSTLNYKII